MLARDLLDPVRFKVVMGKWAAECPLGCGPIPLYRSEKVIEFKEHRGTHPQSTQCWWSHRAVPPETPVHLTQHPTLS